jgi:pSer/pThr/pTyr-binding forkhead associated (FHA) protein
VRITQGPLCLHPRACYAEGALVGRRPEEAAAYRRPLPGKPDVELKLLLKQGPARTRALRIRGAETLIGRSRECDVCIPSAAVSRRHCLLCVSAGQVTIEDLSSHNGTFLNQERVVSKTRVNSGDQLQIGPLLFTVQFQPTKSGTETLQGTPPPPSAETQPRKRADDLTRTNAPAVSSSPTMPPTNEEEDIEIVMNDRHPLDLPEGDDFRDLLSKLDLE